MPFTEANFENAILEIFRDLLGYEYLYGPDVVRDFAEPLCPEILEDALVRINPSLPRAAIDEALKCKGTGEEKTIVFGLTGTGYFDMVAYEKFHDGQMSDYIPTDADLQKGFDGIPQFPGNEL